MSVENEEYYEKQQGPDEYAAKFPKVICGCFSHVSANYMTYVIFIAYKRYYALSLTKNHYTSEKLSVVFLIIESDFP